MELDLPRLELLLPAIQRLSILVRLAQGLDGIPNPGAVVERRVDNAVRAGAQDLLQLQRRAQVFTYP